jgi:hypothetical protein
MVEDRGRESARIDSEGKRVNYIIRLEFLNNDGLIHRFSDGFDPTRLQAVECLVHIVISYNIRF